MFYPKIQRAKCCGERCGDVAQSQSEGGVVSGHFFRILMRLPPNLLGSRISPPASLAKASRHEAMRKFIAVVAQVAEALEVLILNASLSIGQGWQLPP